MMSPKCIAQKQCVFNTVMGVVQIQHRPTAVAMATKF